MGQERCMKLIHGARGEGKTNYIIKMCSRLAGRKLIIAADRADCERIKDKLIHKRADISTIDIYPAYVAFANQDIFTSKSYDYVFIDDLHIFIQHALISCNIMQNLPITAVIDSSFVQTISEAYDDLYICNQCLGKAICKFREQYTDIVSCEHYIPLNQGAQKEETKHDT